MSKMSNHEEKCPECGKSQEVVVWHSINVDLDATLRERLFAAEINQFECSFCGYETFLGAPLLYHDMTRQFTVQYYSPSLLDDPEGMFQSYDVKGMLDSRSWPNDKMKGHYMTMPHVVFDMNEMQRYILFREFLHSRGEET